MDLQMCEQSELLNSTTSINGKKISLDPEVSEKPIRRKYSTEYKLRILQEADKCPPGEMGALLRREGLYSSHVIRWRRQKNNGQLTGHPSKQQEQKKEQTERLVRQVRELKREKERLAHQLNQAETIIQVQKNSPRCWRESCQPFPLQRTVNEKRGRIGRFGGKSESLSRFSYFQSFPLSVSVSKAQTGQDSLETSSKFVF